KVRRHLATDQGGGHPGTRDAQLTGKIEVLDLPALEPWAHGSRLHQGAGQAVRIPPEGIVVQLQVVHAVGALHQYVPPDVQAHTEPYPLGHRLEIRLPQLVGVLGPAGNGDQYYQVLATCWRGGGVRYRGATKVEQGGAWPPLMLENIRQVIVQRGIEEQRVVHSLGQPTVQADEEEQGA